MVSKTSAFVLLLALSGAAGPLAAAGSPAAEKPAAPTKPATKPVAAKPAAPAPSAKPQTTVKPTQPAAKPTAAAKPETKPAIARPAAATPAASAPATVNFYRNALQQIERGQAPTGEAPAAQRDRLLDKMLHWQMLTKGLVTRDRMTDYSGFMAENPDWPQLASLRRRAEDFMALEQSDSLVMQWFREYAPTSRDGRIRLAEAWKALGRDAEGNALLRRVWVEENFAGAPEEDRFLGKYAALLTPLDQRNRLDRLMWREQWDAAKRQAVRVDADARRVAQAQLRLRDGASLDTVLAGLSPEERLAPGLLYERIRAARRATADGEARALLAQAPTVTQRADLWWTEREIQIRRLIREGDYSYAYRLARDHRLPDGAEMVDAEFLAGFIALRLLNDATAAVAHFREIADSSRTPISISRGHYWTARALLAAGRKAEADSFFARGSEHTASFYGQLSRAALGEKDVAALPAEPVPTKMERDRFESGEVAQIARKLSRLGLTDKVDPFVLKLADGQGAQPVMAAQLATQLGRNDLAVIVARRVFREGIILSNSGYPVLSSGIAGAPEVALVHAITRQESNFDADAVSRVGARGLMQLMPATAKQTSEKLGLPYAQDKLTTDPLYNMRLGQAFLGTVVDQFDGHYPFAIAAYNAGPGRVRQWLRENGDPRGDLDKTLDWIEQIPFSETRNYVQRVLEGTLVYRNRLDQPVPPGGVPADKLAAWCLTGCAQSITQ
jgi:soluble lytic murein transglycosylase